MVYEKTKQNKTKQKQKQKQKHLVVTPYIAELLYYNCIPVTTNVLVYNIKNAFVYLYIYFLEFLSELSHRSMEKKWGGVTLDPSNVFLTLHVPSVTTFIVPSRHNKSYNIQEYISVL